jgi:hypothetical protein
MNKNNNTTNSTNNNSISLRVFAELQQAAWTSLQVTGMVFPIFIKSKFTDSCYYLILTGV